MKAGWQAVSIVQSCRPFIRVLALFRFFGPSICAHPRLLTPSISHTHDFSHPRFPTSSIAHIVDCSHLPLLAPLRATLRSFGGLLPPSLH